MRIKNAVRGVIRRMGYDIIRHVPPATSHPRPPELTDYDGETLNLAKPYTMTSPARVYGLIKAVKYVAQCNIPGEIVECGVWKGGSMMAVARTLAAIGDAQRDLYLYDTFEGMTAPTEHDKDRNGVSAQALLDATADRDQHIWARAQLDVVKRTMALTGYEPSRIHYVKGRVEETIPRTVPGRIALLRLDTDWYESTRHELVHLYPLLSKGGVIIFDDYGDWQGARRAVDEYLEQHGVRLLLNVLDSTGRIGVKVD